MIFKTKVTIALRILKLMLETDSKVVVSDVAETLDISVSYVEQIFAKLNKLGVTEGIRGPNGGYTLKRSNANAYMVWYITIRSLHLVFYTEDRDRELLLTEAFKDTQIIHILNI